MYEINVRVWGLVLRDSFTHMYVLHLKTKISPGEIYGMKVFLHKWMLFLGLGFKMALS